jgi:hypothetical protein
MVGVRVSGSKTITATGESELFAVPDPHIAFLKRLSVSNGAAEVATVQLVYYNGVASKVVLTLKLAPGATVVLEEIQLPLEACPTRMAVVTDKQLVVVDYSVELE